MLSVTSRLEYDVFPRTSNAQCTSKVRSIDDPRESVGFLSASVGSWGGRCRVRRVESLK